MRIDLYPRRRAISAVENRSRRNITKFNNRRTTMQTSERLYTAIISSIVGAMVAILVTYHLAFDRAKYSELGRYGLYQPENSRS